MKYGSTFRQVKPDFGRQFDRCFSVAIFVHLLLKGHPERFSFAQQTVFTGKHLLKVYTDHLLKVNTSLVVQGT